MDSNIFAKQNKTHTKIQKQKTTHTKKQTIKHTSTPSKKEGKDQEYIQSSPTPDTGYQLESDNVTIRHHKREPRGQPFPSS